MNELLKMDSFLRSLSIARIDEMDDECNVILRDPHDPSDTRIKATVKYISDDNYDIRFTNYEGSPLKKDMYFKSNLGDLKKMSHMFIESRNGLNEDLREYLDAVLESLEEEMIC